MCKTSRGIKKVAVFFRGRQLGITEFDEGTKTLKNSPDLKVPAGKYKLVLRDVDEEGVPKDKIGEFTIKFSPRQGKNRSPISLTAA